MDGQNNTVCALSKESSDCNCKNFCNNSYPVGQVDVFKMTYVEVISAVYLITASLVALLGNGLVILAVFKRRNLRQNSYFLVANLAFKDFAFATIASVMATPQNFVGYWYFGDVACILYATVTSWLAYTELTLLAAIGLNRYIACDYALRYHEIMTSSALRNILVFCWAYGLVLALIPLFGVGRYVFIPKSGFCTVDTTAIVYVVIVVAGLFLPGTGLIVYFYAAVYRTSRKVSQTPTAPSQTGYPPAGIRNRPGKATMTVSLITGLYFLCWFPFVGIEMTRAFMPDFDTYHVLTTHEHVTALTFSIANYANPIIYGFYNKHFRQEVMLVFVK